MKKEQSIVEKTVFTKADYDALRSGMKEFSLEKIKGRTYGAFEQYLESRGIVSFQEGHMAIVSPGEYQWFCDMYENVQALDRKEQQRMFEAFPAAREEWNEKVSGYFAQMRKSIREMAATMKI